jgi:hypothetical protein
MRRRYSAKIIEVSNLLSEHGICTERIPSYVVQHLVLSGAISIRFNRHRVLFLKGYENKVLAFYEQILRKQAKSEWQLKHQLGVIRNMLSETQNLFGVSYVKMIKNEDGSYTKKPFNKFSEVA